MEDTQSKGGSSGDTKSTSVRDSSKKSKKASTDETSNKDLAKELKREK